jgi:uncharacterized damage-inducible protein DinB
MISSMAGFLKYFESIRRRTMVAADAVPEGKMDWSPGEGEYTCGDILRHLGSVQVMNWAVIAGEAWDYPEHGREMGASKAEALAYLEACNKRATGLIEGMGDEVLEEKRPNVVGRPVSAWRLLMATVEHEVHHRSQLDTYLYLMGAKPPQLYGVKMEELPRG